MPSLMGYLANLRNNRGKRPLWRFTAVLKSLRTLFAHDRKLVKILGRKGVGCRYREIGELGCPIPQILRVIHRSLPHPPSNAAVMERYADLSLNAWDKLQGSRNETDC